MCADIIDLLPLVSDCFEHVSNDKIDQSRVTPTLCSVDHHAQKLPGIWYWKKHAYISGSTDPFGLKFHRDAGKICPFFF